MSVDLKGREKMKAISLVTPVTIIEAVDRHVEKLRAAHPHHSTTRQAVIRGILRDFFVREEAAEAAAPVNGGAE